MKYRLISAVAALALAVTSTSCTTTYDAYGRPVQSVDPGLAVAGIAAAGLIGYALADDNDNDYRHYNRGGYHKSYHNHHYHRPSYSNCAPSYGHYPHW